MLRLYTAADLPEASLVVQLLARAGIAAQVLNAHAQGGLGEIPFTHAWPEVWLIEDADRPRAQRVLDAWRRAPPTPPRRCRDCGEDNPGAFETCWRCGTPLTP
jgi:hypothetical protein